MLLKEIGRRCMPVDQWPQLDQRQWQSALQPGDLLEQGGSRAEHSLFSNLEMVRGYGRWLVWLDRRGLLDDQTAPADRITPERVRAYVADLEAENASATVIARIIELKVMSSIMDPDHDWSWIYRFASAVRTRHKPARPKRHRLVHIKRLFDLGLDLMAAAETERSPLRRFKSYRDGLMIAALASRQLRRRNLTGLVLGRTMIRRGKGWWIQIPASQSKTKVLIEEPWPDELVPHLESYLANYRASIAALHGSRAGDALWLSMYGPPMTADAIYRSIVARTREGLGHAINPHLFRDAAVTSLAIDDPAHVKIARCLLAHRTGSTTERYYNQARSLEASRLMQKSLLAQRHHRLGPFEPIDESS
jgi:site-specific recombinase XerD